MNSSDYTGFLESELGKPESSECLFHVISAGYEKSVSYGPGTAMGPQAILNASQQLEIFDGIGIPSKRGVFTLPPLVFNNSSEAAVKTISGAVEQVIKSEKIPVLLGGEHTVSVGAFHALKNLTAPVGIVQFDAHADLRNIYENSQLSHACVMHRAFEMGFHIYQIGVRSLSPYEVYFREQNKISHLDAREIAKGNIPTNILPKDFPELVYITFDVDGFDPSVIPATGTPEPGGFLWYQAMDILENVMAGRKVVGFDVVELAPVKDQHVSDFAAARLVYNIMGMIDRNNYS